MIEGLIARFWWQVPAIVALAVGVITWDSTRKAKWVSTGVQKERASVERKSTINANKADAARRAADKLPPDRLCDRYARDC